MKRSIVRRAVMVAFAFAVAVTVAVVTLFTLAIVLGVQAITEPPALHTDEATALLNHFVNAVFFVYVLAQALSILPAVILMVIGELAKIRSWIYYIPAGGIACAVMPLLPIEHSEDFAFSAPHYAVLAVAGFAAGWMYWLIAGRDA
jgi:hypothetical protein